tara:strand:+ start:38 stop:400 length:363 start_codon:yes stop_codon:yes gene_type:complete
MGKNICNKKSSEGKTELGFINYSKSLVKTFMIITVVFLSFGLQGMLKNGQKGGLFPSALFIVAITILFSIVSVIDQYIYNNIILGVGIALGLSLLGLSDINVAKNIVSGGVDAAATSVAV